MAIQFFNNVQILQPSGTGLLLKSNDGNNLAVNLITQGLATFGHREILKSGFTGGFADDNNHGHKLFNINQIEQATDGDIKNLQFVQERYLAQEASSLPNSRNAFWAFHKVSKELDELNSSNEVLPNNKTSLSWYAKTQFLYPRTNNDTILVTWNASHGLKQNDHVVVVTDGRGDLVAQQDGWVLDPDPNGNGQSAVIVYGQRTLEYDLASFTSFGSTGWSIHKGSLDPFHNDTIGDTLLNFDADADGNYEAFQLGPGCQTDGNCISIGKNIYNNDAETVKIGYENETLIVKKTGGIEVYGLGQFNNDVLITGALKDSSNNPGSQGQVLSSTVTGTDWIDQGDVIAGEADKAKSVILRVKNSTGSPMSKGQVVCEAVSATPPSGNLIEVALADNNGTNTMPALGVLNEDLDAAGGANDEGDAIMFGKVSGINTSAFSVGDEVFVDDTPGGLTTTKPTGVKYIQKVGVVIRDDATNGTIEVFGAGRVNDVPTPLYVDHANQRVGIGETSIDAKLHLTTASSGLINQKFESAGSAAWRLGIPASQTYFALDNANDNLSAPKVVIASSGNVGIGTTSPTEKLDVDGTGKFEDIIVDNNGGPNSNVKIIGGSFIANNGSTDNLTGAPSYFPDIITGDNNEGYGTRSIIVGRNNRTGVSALAGDGDEAAAIGLNNVASSSQSIALGRTNTSSGVASIAVGDTLTASGNHSFACNINNEASGDGSIAGGFGTTASGGYSVSLGINTTATAAYAFAIGDGCDATATRAFATGFNSTASGQSAVVHGNNNTASGTNSLVSGANSTASGFNSTALGNNLNVTSGAGTAVGVWNQDAGNYRFQVGVGTSSSNRKNAFSINNNGIILAHVLKNSASYANDSAAATGGVPVGGLYRNGSIVQIRIT